MYLIYQYFVIDAYCCWNEIRRNQNVENYISQYDGTFTNLNI